MTTTTTTPTPLLAPRAAGEDLQAYGWRALLHVLATGHTHTVDDEGLTLAHYVYPLAVAGGRAVSSTAAERLAGVQRQITRALDGRKAAQAEALEALQAAAPAGVDKPNLGPGAPLPPAPVVPTPPAAGLQAPAPALAVPSAPAPRPTFQPVIRPVLRPAPVAPQVPAEQWGF